MKWNNLPHFFYFFGWFIQSPFLFFNIRKKNNHISRFNLSHITAGKHILTASRLMQKSYIALMDRHFENICQSLFELALIWTYEASFHSVSSIHYLIHFLMWSKHASAQVSQRPDGPEAFPQQIKHTLSPARSQILSADLQPVKHAQKSHQRPGTQEALWSNVPCTPGADSVSELDNLSPPTPRGGW